MNCHQQVTHSSMIAFVNRSDHKALREAVCATPGETLPRRVGNAIRRTHPAEIASVLESLPGGKRRKVWRELSDKARGEVLVGVRGEVRKQLIGQADDEELTAALRGLQFDELADLQSDVPATVVDALLDDFSERELQRFEALRHHPADTAGGLMDTDALAVPVTMNSDEVQDFLREVRRRKGELPEHFDSVFAVSQGHHYAGRIALADVVSRPAGTPVEQMLADDRQAIAEDVTASEAARLFEEHDLLSAPVVDAAGRLIGRITIDDIVDVIRGEGENALLASVGLDRDIDLFSGTWSGLRRRFVWLGIHLVNAFLAAAVIARFENSIEKIVALAVLMPVVAGIGGVGGQQSLALVIRSLALDRVGMSNATPLISSEVRIALLNGLLWSVVIGLGVYFWFDSLPLSIVFCSAMILNLLNGALAGTWLPLILDRFGIDPAIAGGVLLAGATDILGFLLFLGLATLTLI